MATAATSGSRSSTESYASADDADRPLSKQHSPHASHHASLKEIGHKAKSKTKKLLHIHDPLSSDGKHQDDESPANALASNPAFNPDQLGQSSSQTHTSLVGKATDAAHQAVQAITNPKQSLKQKIAGTIATDDAPYLSRKDDADFLEANAERDLPPDLTSSDFEDDDHLERWTKVVSGLEAHREQLKVAWTTSRYVSRIRAVPKRPYEFPTIVDYRKKDPYGDDEQVDWVGYIGQILLWYTQDFTVQYIDDADKVQFDEKTLARHIERIIIASGPWQAWLTDVRQIYRWENPRRTARWLALFVFLWLINRVITFSFCHLLYTVLRNRFTPRSVEQLRVSYSRAHDRGTNALKVGELISRHGKENWVDPLLDQVGPPLQLHLGDLADFLEILVNFYEWRTPEKTLASLFFFGSCTTLALFGSTDFNLRVVTFLAISGFFTCAPVGSQYPKYRHLVSPARWIFWDIPTHAEWSFSYLQKHATVPSNTINSSSPKASPSLSEAASAPKDMNAANEDELQHANITDSKTPDIDLLPCRCKWRNTTGHLIASTSGLRFVRLLGSQELWRQSYMHLEEVIKIDEGLGKLKVKRSILFKFTDGSVDAFDGVKQRDELFNVIIGYSGLRWQQLQRSQSEGRERGFFSLK